MQNNTWHEIGTIEDIPRLGSRVVPNVTGDIAIFRTNDDHIFALDDSCPHKQGKLSQGIVHDQSVTCPLHSWVIGLADGMARDPDTGCTRKHQIRPDGNRIYLMVAT